MNQEASPRAIARLIVSVAPQHNQRTGQYLYNYFEGLREYIAGKTYDPFYRDMSQYQIEEWLLEHCIFDGHGEIIGFFVGDDILWERRW